MGCLHHYMGKPGLANYYFKKAVEDNLNAIKSFSRPESGISINYFVMIIPVF